MGSDSPGPDDLDVLAAELRVACETVEGDRQSRTVVFFDMADSTAMKSTAGHYTATRTALAHNSIVALAVASFGGRIVKDLGDGVLADFPDPLRACQCMVRARQLLKANGINSKAGATNGQVEEISREGRMDTVGATVDRAARVSTTSASSGSGTPSSSWKSRSLAPTFRLLSSLGRIFRLRDEKFQDDYALGSSTFARNGEPAPAEERR